MVDLKNRSHQCTNRHNISIFIPPPQKKKECPGNSKVHSRLDNERLCESQFPTASLLTSMTILPTGEPSAVMSKKTRGIDILYVGGVMHGISLDRQRRENGRPASLLHESGGVPRGTQYFVLRL